MKYLLLLVVTLPFTCFSQLNMNQLGYLDLVTAHNSDLSDVWGWVDGSGNEYAIVGLNDGTSVVDVTNPANPVEVFYEPGMNSIWRDIKTWNNHAYVTTEAQNGLLIIDLSTLPANPNLTTTFYTGPGGNSWQSAHNLFIDENGICYIFGANRDNGGAIMLDLTIDPMNPVEVGSIENWYTHDGVARGDTLYMGHINDGHMSIWDVSNKSNPVLLGQQFTPGNFAHNLWMSDDGNYIYTTDEITNGFVGEFDISDPTNIVELDRIQSNPGMNVIPHNSHFLNDYVITSYYRDGVVVHDVSNKGNMVEVANFDTSPQFSGDGYNGCWGVYPWLPSGNIIASDIENGLYVLGITYNRGCYVTGNVTNMSTSAPINAVSVDIVTTSIASQTNIVGDYATGVATSGTYDIIFSHPAYISDTVFGVSLVSSQTVVVDMQLVPIASQTLVVEVNDAVDGITPIAGVQVEIGNTQFNYTGITGVDGKLTIQNFYTGAYDVFIGEWGYLDYCDTGVVFNNNDTVYPVQLDMGYADKFNLDFNWSVSGAATVGVWERGKPLGTSLGIGFSNPDSDAGDCGTFAYVTGNAGGAVGDDDVDASETILESPFMVLSAYTAPKISLDYWWVNAAGQVSPNDTLQFIISDGINEVVVANILPSSSSGSWQSLSFNVADYVSLTNSNKLIIRTADWQSFGGNIVEAAIDNFMVLETVGVEEKISGNKMVKVYPNPSNGVFNVEKYFDEDATVKVFDISGKLVKNVLLNSSDYQLFIETSGVYTVLIQSDNVMESFKLIRL